MKTLGPLEERWRDGTLRDHAEALTKDEKTIDLCDIGKVEDELSTGKKEDIIRKMRELIYGQGDQIRAMQDELCEHPVTTCLDSCTSIFIDHGRFC